MNSSEFRNNFSRLAQRKAWAAKFDQAFSDVLWEQIKNYSAFAFESAVKELLGEHNCPTASDIISATRKAYYKNGGSQAVLKRLDCRYCDGYGLIEMKKEHKESFYFAHCDNCLNGEAQKKASGKLCSVKRMMAAGDLPKNWRLARIHTNADDPLINVGCTWPASIEAIMLQIRRCWSTIMPKKFAQSLKFAGLSEDDAWTLYTAYCEKLWDCPSVIPILKNKSDKSALSALTG